MASNNYAVTITNEVNAQEVLATFERLASQGWSFKVLKFNPDVDHFPISCERESNFPPLPVVEEFGTSVAGSNAKVFWNKDAGFVEAVSFGNGHVGLFCDAGMSAYMIILNDKQQPSKCDSLRFDGVMGPSSACHNPPAYADADRDTGKMIGYCAEHFEEMMRERMKNHGGLAVDPGEDL